jgi:DNA topoisomerase VI subunit B
MNNSESLTVTSHVSRDLLQSAALFKHEHSVVWEYVANGLQYIDPNTRPIVKVRTNQKDKKISIADNGKGMNWVDLQNFFVMHGENLERKAGRAGRGMFGTGKSAALGIASILRITTIRNGKRSIVELHRADIEKMNGEEVPVQTIEKEVRSTEANGTLIEIEAIH